MNSCNVVWAELSRTGCQYPLVVNLDTIDASGDADVYSFEEDTKVTDPYLKDHLAHFGLDMSRMPLTRLIRDELNEQLSTQMINKSV